MNNAQQDLPQTKTDWWARFIDIVVIGAAIWLGFFVSERDFESVVPIILTVTGLVIVRFALNRPFHESFTLYVAIAAFNYYYFYCSKLTGRNPTDVPGTLGMPATELEKLQKDIIFGLVLLLAGIKLFVGKIQGKEIWLKRTDNDLLQLVLALMAYSVLRSFFVIFEGDTPFLAVYYLRLNIEYALIPFLLLSTLITNEKHLNVIYRGILYTLPLVALLGIIEFLIHGSPYERSFTGGQLLSRATSTLQNPNNLGSYLGTAMGIYVLYYIKGKLSNLEKVMFWPSIGLGLVCLVMTLSRSSILTFFLALTGALLILFLTSKRTLTKEKYRHYKKIMTYYVVIGAFCTFILYKYFGLTTAISSAVEMYFNESGGKDFRVFALASTLKTILGNPLGAFFGYSYVNVKSTPDNAFANILLRNGIIGFLLYMSIWISSLHLCFKRIWDKQKEHNFLYLICFYVLLFQAIFGFSALINQNFPHNMYFWLTIGVLIWLETPFMRASMQTPAQQQQALANDNQS